MYCFYSLEPIFKLVAWVNNCDKEYYIYIEINYIATCECVQRFQIAYEHGTPSLLSHWRIELYYYCAVFDDIYIYIYL